MLYRGTKPGALYKGAYKPGKLYKGTQLVAGYGDVSKAAPASWDGTYDDVVGVAATGNGKQQTYSGKNLLLPEKNVVAYNGIAAERLADGRYHISGTPTAATTLALGIHGGSLSLAAGTYTLAAPATADCWAALGPGYRGGTFSLAEEAVFTLFSIEVYASAVGQELDFVYAPQLEAGSTATAYEPYVGGQPSPSPDYPQPLVAAEGSLTTSGRTDTTPTTVTLPVLRAIPGTDIRDTLAYIGGGQWQVTRRVGVIDSYAGESVGSTWASSTGQLTTGAVIWYTLAAPTTETVTLGELPSYPVHTELAASGDYPPDVTGTVKVSN